MTNISRVLRIGVPALALTLLTAACTQPNPDQPNGVTFDPASTTVNGTGTNGGTNVDGSGPGGPRDPNRLVPPKN
jgi:hypothetical protein